MMNWKYSSEELNQKIRELDDNAEIGKLAGEMEPNEKVIPYIGWYWRNVSFDGSRYALGVIPAGAEGLEQNYVGFMENNKWYYPYIFLSEEQTVELRKLIEVVVEKPNKETLTKLHKWMQSLAVDKEYEWVDVHNLSVNDYGWYEK
jgi:hypothetical protein